VPTPPTIPPPGAQPSTPSTPPHLLGDLYLFQWRALNYRLPLVSTAAVALCLIVGILAGHPGGALVAAGGALTIGFGANQRISDSRLLPMLFAIFGMATAALVGTLAGHEGFALIAASAGSAAIYGVLTIRHAGLAWVGQQASVALFVASAFPTGPKPALIRAGLIVVGGTVQVIVTSAGLHLMPELRKNLWSIYHSLYEQRREILNRIYSLPAELPASDRKLAVVYALRLVVTVSLASEVYRRLGVQSGYWIPMTALLVQKPAFFETLNRALARVAGTLAGATLATLLASHLHLSVWSLAGLTTFFAFWCFATNAVNYALFSVCITSYIVFLLSLNQAPGPELAHRRAACTAAGALIALIIHLDALRRLPTAEAAPAAQP
jgi:Fusaric acid resistance protein-like